MSEISGPSEPWDDQTVAGGLDGHTPVVASEPPGRPGLTAGTRLGRYMLLEELGAGGMGVVMAAYDQELDRRVALKLLRPHLSHSGETRMRREAQALAQLQHPSVVSVFEVGIHEGQVFIAMEYVEGETLDRFAARHRSQWARIVEVAIRAGRGLAAAHAVGLVHRDVKPSNVLVGRDGRVCVADFGIATATAAPERGSSSRLLLRDSTSVSLVDQDTVEVGSSMAVASDSIRDLVSRHTEVGTVVGTPAFMAPEQHRGGVVDARSDQFAFCVTLYRVLYDDAPFAGDDLEHLRRSVASGQVKPAPPGSRVPGAVRRVLLRGLAVDPERRWPSMDALLAALQRTIGRRRRIGGLVLGLGGAAVVVAWGLRSDPVQPGDCPSARERLEGVWDDARTVAMRDAFVASQLPYALDTAARTQERLDRYADQWSRHYEQLCHEMQAKATGAALDREMSCVRQRRHELGALVDVLLQADPTVIAKATQAAAELESVESCRARGTEAAALAPPPEELREQVEEIRLLLVRAEAAYKTGMIALGQERATQALAQARASGYAPVEAEALLELGKLQALAGELDPAEEHLEDAAVRAAEAGYDRVAVAAATQAAFVVGYQRGRHEEGLVWLRHATAAMERLGDDVLLDAQLRQTRAAILSAQGLYEPALAEFRTGLSEREQQLGPEHPSVAGSYNNLGSVLVELGRHEEALAALERARSIWARSYGPRHPTVGMALNGIGAVLEKMERWAEARDRLEQALAIREEAFGADHINVAITLDNLGSVLIHQGEYDRAREVCQRALELRERGLGPRHPHYPSSLVNLGLVAEKQGRHEEAEALQRRAIELWEDSLGPEHPYLAFPLTVLGRVEVARGDHAAAREHLQRALRIREGASTPLELAETLLALADAFGPSDLAQARAFAERAASELARSPTAHTELTAQLRRWQSDHPPAATSP